MSWPMKILSIVLTVVSVISSVMVWGMSTDQTTRLFLFLLISVCSWTVVMVLTEDLSLQEVFFFMSIGFLLTVILTGIMAQRLSPGMHFLAVVVFVVFSLAQEIFSWGGHWRRLLMPKPVVQRVLN